MRGADLSATSRTKMRPASEATGIRMSLEQAGSREPSISIPKDGTGTHGILKANEAMGETASVVAAPVSQAMIADISLHVQQLMKLRSGGRTRRYEVLVRGRQDASGDAMSPELVKALSLRESAAAIDRTVVTELAGWLKQHPHVWNADPASFSINLSTGSLLDPSFVRFVAQTLQTTGIAPDTIGFEVPEQAFFKHRDACSAFFDACEKIGCYVIIDDFTMHSDVVPFLASRALRVVKIDPRLTQSAMRDRLAQALVIAISQASKVLGLHCVAKRIDSAGTRQWLSAVGIDFAQGFVLEDPQPLEALATPAAQRPSSRQSTTRRPNKPGVAVRGSGAPTVVALVGELRFVDHLHAFDQSERWGRAGAASRTGRRDIRRNHDTGLHVDAARAALCKLAIMGAEQERGSGFALNFGHQIEHVIGVLAIEIARWFIGKHQRRLVHERACHGDSLLLAA